MKDYADMRTESGRSPVHHKDRVTTALRQEHAEPDWTQFKVHMAMPRKHRLRSKGRNRSAKRHLRKALAKCRTMHMPEHEIDKVIHRG